MASITQATRAGSLEEDKLHATLLLHEPAIRASQEGLCLFSCPNMRATLLLHASAPPAWRGDAYSGIAAGRPADVLLAMLVLRVRLPLRAPRLVDWERMSARVVSARMSSSDWSQ